MTTQEEVDKEIDEWLEKEAAAEGIDRKALDQRDVELWRIWKADPNKDNFEQLYRAQEGMLYGNERSKRFLRSTVLPRAAVKSSLLRSYIYGLETFNPGLGVPLRNHIISNAVGRTGRYMGDYSNIGKIPDKRRDLIDLYRNRDAHLKETLGREPTTTELADDMNLSIQDTVSLRRVTPRMVGTLRNEVRQDMVLEQPGPERVEEGGADPLLRDKIMFLHGSLNPEQQLILEHMFPDWGRPVIHDPMELAKVLKMSPQKVRSLRKQIQDRVAKYV